MCYCAHLRNKAVMISHDIHTTRIQKMLMVLCHQQTIRWLVSTTFINPCSELLSCSIMEKLDYILSFYKFINIHSYFVLCLKNHFNRHFAKTIYNVCAFRCQKTGCYILGSFRILLFVARTLKLLRSKEKCFCVYCKLEPRDTDGEKQRKIKWMGLHHDSVHAVSVEENCWTGLTCTQHGMLKVCQ